jgi:3-hydroxymyristoyl/3-hydroxydecanoyl-(acyl carrier protein) dehydratase
MDDLWLPIRNMRTTSDGTLRAEVTFPPDSPWFHGHFPELPILPGVALVAAAIETIRQGNGIPDKNVGVLRLTRVRFKQIVAPNIPLEVTVIPDTDNLRFRYRINSATGTVCVGIVDTNSRADSVSPEP